MHTLARCLQFSFSPYTSQQLPNLGRHHRCCPSGERSSDGRLNPLCHTPSVPPPTTATNCPALLIPCVPSPLALIAPDAPPTLQRRCTSLLQDTHTGNFSQRVGGGTKQNKKKLCNNCSSNAQQASDGRLPDPGSPGGVQSGLGRCHSSEWTRTPALAPFCKDSSFPSVVHCSVTQTPRSLCPAHRNLPFSRAWGSQMFYRSDSCRGRGLHPATGQTLH